MTHGNQRLAAGDSLRSALERFRPTGHPFFAQLKEARTSRVRSASFLEDFYVRYQAAMHATRVMVYFLPFLDEVRLRARKCSIIAEDDNLPGGDTHHAQLRNTWTTLLSHEPSTPDSFFGSLDTLAGALEGDTARFVSFIHREYSRTLGPWVMVEGLAHDWIEALCESLRPHFSNIHGTTYFVENLSSGVEREHAAIALELFGHSSLIPTASAVGRGH